MIKHLNKLLFTLTLLTVSLPAHALIFGGTNLGFMGYPEHECMQPYKPFEFTDQFQVDQYNRDFERYIDCIKEYVENADNDIKRIQEAAEAAIDEAKSIR